ncbi:MAG: precorrin-3B C(17)-methyltransferase, partial [Acidimicrobiaceae bacterium]|nr:precorrin-3B C(17)-methyltransferase [Acidimicrobiaceae bacterium]
SDSIPDFAAGDFPTVQLIPPSLVVGIGCSSDASSEEVSALINSVFTDHRLDMRAISKLATIDLRAHHPAILGQHLPVVSFASARLADVPVPNSSAKVESHVGTPSVAEAAALLASGSGELIVTKTKAKSATIAVARRNAKGNLKVVGLGPGNAMSRTPAAIRAIIDSEIVIGYRPYIEQCSELLSPHQLVLRSPIGEESSRAKTAVEFAIAGRAVALVCSGDPEVFAMASITFEVLEAQCRALNIDSPDKIMDITIIPGVTAGLGGGALLGAPLGHDHAYLSLSDLLTPWETIEKHIHAFGQADVVIVIYNPKSKGRLWQLPKAIEILSQYRPGPTPVAVVRNIGRNGESKTIYTIDTFDATKVDMTSLVLVGSSTTRRIGDYIFTPRGYEIHR